MADLRAPIVGREPELSALQEFVSGIDDGAASLVLEGIAGIGKTAIWDRAVQDARSAGVAVRTCRCSQADTAWAFSGLGDLFDGLDGEVLAALPAVQRDSLGAALLLAGAADYSPGTRVVGVAVLGALRALARTGPLILAIDDVQWLDVSSRRVLSFAVRRLTQEPIRLLTCYRTELDGNQGRADDAHGGADLGLVGRRIVVGPVSIGVMQRIVQIRLSRTLSRSTLARLHQATGGSPMMCLEMARAMQRRGREPAAGEPLTVPADLRLLVNDRLEGLSSEARQQALLLSALAQPTVAAIDTILGDPELTARCVAELIAAGVIERDGERVRFTHPLLASVPYADLDPRARRRLHERLAAVVEDPEEHARHAALAAAGRSTEVAAALDIASRHARRRGSIDAAAELSELAVTSTPLDHGDDLLRRTVQTAEYLLLLGEPVRARTVLGGGLNAVPPGPLRVRGLLLQATIASWEQGDATVADWCGQAMVEAGDDLLLQARCHAAFAETCPNDVPTDLWHAEQAVVLLGEMEDPPTDLLAGALVNVASHGLRLGRGLAVSPLQRAVALQAAGQPVPIGDRAAMGLGMYLKVVDRFDESRTWLADMRTCAIDEGDDSALPFVLGHLATLECWAGDYRSALALAEEGREHAARMGMRAPMPASAQVLTLAHLGRVTEAKALADVDIAGDAALGFRSALALHFRSLGFAELVSGDPAGAASHLLAAASISFDEVGIREPGILRLHQDAVAALIALGRIDEAERMTAQLDLSAQTNHHPWSVTMAGRSHGLLLAAAGDLPGAATLFEQTLMDHRVLPMPFEEGRTRLLFGIVLRRSGHRTDARREFGAAQAIFTRLGTPLHADQARRELAGVGGRRRPDNDLTPVERRVTGLVAAGQTNREVAAALFVSVRTVEGHLGHVYQKLGVRSRTELARWVVDHPVQTVT